MVWTKSVSLSSGKYRLHLVHRVSCTTWTCFVSEMRFVRAIDAIERNLIRGVKPNLPIPENILAWILRIFPYILDHFHDRRLPGYKLNFTPVTFAAVRLKRVLFYLFSCILRRGYTLRCLQTRDQLDQLWVTLVSFRLRKQKQTVVNAEYAVEFLNFIF